MDPSIMYAKVKPTITTIIPTYRRPKQLERAIRSVLQQTYPHFQVCVYDNASGDDTALVVTEMSKSDPRIKYYCHSENIGAFENFQYGMKRVETPFFSFLSDDDLVLPEFYETALAGFENHSAAMFSATDVIHIGIQGHILRTALESWKPGFYLPPAGLITILEHGHSEWTGILFRKEITEKVGLLDRETGKFSDLDFTLRIAAHYPFVVSIRPGAVFNLSMSQVRSPYLFDSIWPGVQKMIQNITNDLSMPLDFRNYVGQILLARFEKGLFPSGLSYLSRGYPADAKRVALLLRDQFGKWSKYIVLSIIINAHQTFFFARWFFETLIFFRRHLRAKKNQRIQKKYFEIHHIDVKVLIDDQR